MSLVVILLVAAVILLAIFGLATVGTIWFWIGFGCTAAALVFALLGDRTLG